MATTGRKCGRRWRAVRRGALLHVLMRKPEVQSQTGFCTRPSLMELQRQSQLHHNRTEQLCNKSAHTGLIMFNLWWDGKLLIRHRGDFLQLCPDRRLICSSYRCTFVNKKKKITGLTWHVRLVQSHLLSLGCHTAKKKQNNERKPLCWR